MTTFLQTLTDGLSIGLTIGGLALALAVVFQGSGIVNFSQGQLATVAAYLAWQFTAWGAGFWPALLMSVVLSFALGMLIQAAFIRPILGREELPILIVTVGLFLLADSVIGTIWGYLPKSLAGPSQGTARVGEVVITGQVIVQAAVLLVVVGVTTALFRWTTIGLQMRAAAAHARSSELCGVSLSLTLALGWGIAAAVGAVTGAISAPVTGLSPDINSSTLLLAFAAAALGGFHSQAGALAGGLLVGCATSMAGEYVGFVGNDLRLLVPLTVIVLALLIAPDGIFARRRKVRV
ncbi:branched-chain amino acid ABC transporter permease [Streptomyces sp. DSM 44917]|uniref:Branched-chain amino acid ABC transporter permease n=1 Tax=Streptomyces boetiae TaxID=3075541 RepID=A0ABU2L6X9_9ACTN|nr:branched-chain amino acid ABC transporter permease [Streptomyces sp. DSM 44917]MDT0307330.1 branched-chain amino acid ABC transporter permease [Streptomyces sp. DSM 44917]